jgi:hypothetical protein
MKVKMDIHHEKIEAAIRFIWFELDKAIKHRVEDILLCETQVDLQTVTSFDIHVKCLHETLANAGNDLHEEFFLMF